MATIDAIRKAILLKSEVTYGTDIVPGNADAYETENFSIKVFESDAKSRDIDRPGFGGTESAMGPVSVTGSFQIALTGGGAAGSAAPYAVPLLASQFSETLTALTKAVYSPVGTGFGSASMYFHHGGRRRRILGLRGGCGFKLEAGSFPYMMCNFAGLYTSPTDVSMPAADFSAFKNADIITNANTPTCTLNGVNQILESLDISAPSNFSYTNKPGQEAVLINARRNYTASITVKQTDLATFNPEALAQANTLMALAVTHGTAAGKIVKITAPRFQITGITEGESDGEKTWALSGTLVDEGNNDEVALELA